MFDADVKVCNTQIGFTGCGEEGGAVACNTSRDRVHKDRFTTEWQMVFEVLITK